MRSRVVGLVLPAALSLPLLAGLAGCGDDGPDERPSSSPATTDATADETEEVSETATDSGDGADVVPATGDPVELDSLTFRLSEGEWIGSRVGSSVAVSQELVDLADLFKVTAGDVDIATTDFEDARQAVVRGNAQSAPYLELAEDRVLGDVDVWVFTGQDGDRTVQEIGGLHAGQLFDVAFEWPTAWVEGPQRVEEMLASLEWR